METVTVGSLLGSYKNPIYKYVVKDVVSDKFWIKVHGGSDTVFGPYLLADIGDEKMFRIISIPENPGVPEMEIVTVDAEIKLKGQKACKGQVKAKLCIIRDESELFKFRPGDILVTMKTTPEFTHIFSKASGIVTQVGGVLSHAAIVSREYNVPCIVGVPNLLGQVEDGWDATLDANEGFLIVYKQKRQVQKVPDVKPSYTEESEDEEEEEKIYCSWCDEDTDHSVSDCPHSKWCYECSEQVDIDHSHYCEYCESDSHDTDNCNESYYCAECDEQVSNSHKHEEENLTLTAGETTNV